MAPFKGEINELSRTSTGPRNGGNVNGPIGGFSEADLTAYKMALAVGVAAAVLQIIFGFLRAGILAEFFPLAAVHGMLAAIGVIIMVKQIPIALGVRGAKGEPLEMIQEIPHFFAEMNPEIALVGGISLAIMFLWPWIKKLHPLLKAIPAPLIVLLVAVPLGMLFDLQHTHIYSYHGEKYEVGEEYQWPCPIGFLACLITSLTPISRRSSKQSLGNGYSCSSLSEASNPRSVPRRLIYSTPEPI